MALCSPRPGTLALCGPRHKRVLVVYRVVVFAGRKAHLAYKFHSRAVSHDWWNFFSFLFLGVQVSMTYSLIGKKLVGCFLWCYHCHH